MNDALKTFRYLTLPIAAVALITGVEWIVSDTPETPLSAASWNSSGFGPASYEEAVEQMGHQISLGNERVEKSKSEWLPHESLARAHLARSRLSFTYSDLTLAEDSLAQAKRLAPKESGPLLTDAVFAQTTHQLGLAEASLSAIDKWAVRTDPGILAESEGLKGDIAFYRGNHGLARQHYEKAASFGSNAGVSYRLAKLAKSSGNYSAAIEHFAEANPRPENSTPFANASAALQIGAVELARGDYEAASDWFEIADQQFPGFWLIEAHLAQSKAIGGDLPGAISAMRAIAARAPSAEIMDTLAMLLRADGQAKESRLWAQRAASVWDERLKQIPAAAYGHAVEHELVFGSPARALMLARLNVAARPYGEARVLLASALLANGMTQEVLEQLALAERSGWRSAPLYALRAQALELVGRSNEANKARKAAKALNPHIFQPQTSLVWLSHG